MLPFKKLWFLYMGGEGRGWGSVGGMFGKKRERDKERKGAREGGRGVSTHFPRTPLNDYGA